MTLLMRAAVLSVLLIPGVVSAQAVPLAGLWEGSVNQDGAAVPVVVELRIQGDVVTGPIFLQGAEQYIRDGKVLGESVEFISGRLNEADRDVPYVWTGTLTGDQISFSVIAADREGPSRGFIVTRQVR
jgi:hypothetical protein